MRTIEKPATGKSWAGSNEALCLLDTNSLKAKYTKKKFHATYLQTNTELLPHNKEAEKALIIACLGDPTCVDRSLNFIEPSDFYKRGMRKIFARCVEFRNNGLSYTPSLVIDSFRGDLDFQKIEDFILAEFQNFITGEVSKHFSTIIRDLSVKRQTIKVSEDAINRSFDPSLPADDNLKILIEEAGKVLSRCEEVGNA